MDLKLRKQVCSFELSKKLEELGVKQDSFFYWNYMEDKKSKPDLITHQSDLVLEDGFNVRNYSAFTVAELGELLLKEIYKYSVYLYPENLFNGRDENGTSEAETEADLRALMLIRSLSLD
ncbi:MAG TPA: hypothetical protein VFM82_09990 [Flavobacteriaceae bacterium]|nr:hypothetical protein [Flavobacteriaceae bacterium]